MSLIGLSYPTSGQTISGQIINQETGSPLPYASILLKNTNAGTASNSDGDFSLETASKADTLVVSYLGFETKEVPLTGNYIPLTISLKPSVVGESEINVTDDFEIELVEKAIQKVNDSDEGRAFGRAFYRQLTKSGAVYTEFVETFYDAEISPNHIERWKVDEGRYAVIPYDSLRYTMYHRNLSIFSRIELVDQQPYRNSIIWPLRDDTRQYYNFYLERSYPGTSENILEISFEKKDNLPKPGFEGTLIMTDSTHQLLELSVYINDPNFNPISPLAKKAEVKNTTLEIVFTRTSVNNGQPFPNRISVNLAYDYLKKKGLFGKTDFEKRIETQSILYFYDYELDGLSQYLTDGYFDENSDISDYRRIEKTGYNPQFWVDNAVIKRTPVQQEVINSFEEYGSFGKMFNQKK
ncbi:CarboxypepD_reg-like domain-containing protein [Gracilimonas mengyeensis]|uniref:CarboxypepD_reg-like domain-containing protein n=2 Tax=Gracilimonas mengyeensis TaxID=1302730 RepID=A0A521AXU1_9BACT|nr:CarboxypepD_reg-like domain-containing protein [Gracilimonas mengyeensis]